MTMVRVARYVDGSNSPMRYDQPQEFVVIDGGSTDARACAGPIERAPTRIEMCLLVNGNSVQRRSTAGRCSEAGRSPGLPSDRGAELQDSDPHPDYHFHRLPGEAVGEYLSRNKLGEWVPDPDLQDSDPDYHFHRLPEETVGQYMSRNKLGEYAPDYVAPPRRHWYTEGPIS